MKQKLICYITVIALIVSNLCIMQNTNVAAADSREVAQTIPLHAKVKQVALGATHSAAVTENGDLYCWGLNSIGEIGNGTLTNQLTPVKVLDNVKQVALGAAHSAAVTENGDLYCWGYNGVGQVGNGTITDQLTPVKVLGDVKKVALGSHSAAITENGDLYCWGKNKNGQIGNGTAIDQLTPVKVLSNVKQAVVGYDHSAAITENGDLYCWGNNKDGQIGNGTAVDQLTPVKVLANVKQAVIGYDHSAAITENGDLYCWGYNRHGEVGNGTIVDQLTPVKVLDSVKQAVLGISKSAAITENGDLYCWGYNYAGRIGNGTKTNQITPVKVLSKVKQVAFGNGHSAAIIENGDLYCWGENYYGQVGDGSTDDQLTPVKVLVNVKQAVLGNKCCRAVTENGDLYCWGLNLHGEVGNGSTNNQLTPVKIFDGTGSAVEQKICVFSTEKSLSVKTGESMWLAFGLMNVNTEELNGDWKKMSVSVSDPTIISLSDYEKTEYGYSLYVTGKKEGSTNVVITDTESGVNTVIRISVYDNYAQSYSYDINNVTSYYPQNDWDGNILTNIYNLNGLYVNNYNCEPNNSIADDYHVSFDVYNTKYYYGAVDIYDENGMWMGYEEIKPYTEISSLWDTGKQAYYLVTDTFNGKLLTYENAAYSQHTHINIDVPQGGYFTISNNISESPGAYFVNAFQILFDGASTAFDLFTSDSTKQSALSNLLEQTKQSFADRLKEARNEGLKDVIKQKLQKAKIDTMKSEIKKIVKKFSNSTLKDQVLSADNMYADMATLAENFLNSFDISWKHLFQSGAGIGESLFTQFAGPAGVALKGCFAMSKTSNKLLMATQMAGSFESPYVTMYSDIEEGFINSYGVTVNTNGNVDADAVLQVFRVSNSDTIEMVLNSDNPLEIHELYNICFVKNDQLVQPNGKVKVYIPVPNGMKGNTCRVYRQEADGTWKIIDAHVEGNYLAFETDHFSYYAVVGDQGSITISSLPDKTDYNEGEVLDTTGLILNVNGESISEGYICNPTVLSGNGKQTIQVLYGPLVAEFTVNVSGSKSMIYGDVDGNGSIDASDALMILKYSAKLEIPFGQKITAADVDNSGSIEANDALLVLKKVAKLIDHFPVEEQPPSDSKK